MKDIWTRESVWLTAAVYAFMHAVFLAGIPTFFVFLFQPVTAGIPWWLPVPFAVVFLIAALWIKPRAAAVLALQSVLVSSGEPERPLQPPRRGVRDSLWGRGSFSVAFLGLPAAMLSPMVALGLFVLFHQAENPDPARIPVGTFICAVSLGMIWAFYTFPRRYRPARAALRVYMRSRGSDDAALLQAASLLAPGINWPQGPSWRAPSEQARPADGVGSEQQGDGAVHR